MKRAVAFATLASLVFSFHAEAQTRRPRRQAAPPVVPEAVPAPAPGRSVSLRDTLGVAVKSNFSLATSQLDVSIAEAELESARGVDDFVFDANADFRLSKAPSRPEDIVVNDGTYSLALGAGLRKPLRTGGDIRLEIDQSFRHSTLTTVVPGIVIEPDYWQPSVGLSFFQPLLRGRGAQVARSAQRRAAASLTVTQKQREVTAATVIRDIVQAYWELAYSAREVEIRKQSLSLANEQLRITRARLEVGVGAPTDVAAVEQGVASREEELLLAELQVSERALALRRIAGMEIGPTEIDLTAADTLQPQFQVPPLDQALSAAMERNPEIQVVKAQGASARIEVEVNENGVMPQLDFSASVRSVGGATEFGDSFDPIVKGDSYDIAAGLVFSTPIGNRAARGALEASRRRLRRVMVTETDIRAQISVAVVRAYNLLRSTQKRVETLEKSTRLAQVNLDAEKARFEVGRTTNFEVLRRQEELAQSQLRQARAAADYLNAVATLEALTGDILSRNGVEVRAK